MRKKFNLIGTLVLAVVLIASVVGFVNLTSVSASHDLPVGDITNLRAADMAVSHAELVSNLTLLNPGDVSAYRWNAIGNFYKSQSSDLTLLDAGDVSAFRWNAMAKFYAAQTASTGDSYAYRWVEMSNFYAAQALSGDFSAHRLILTEAGFWTRTVSLTH